MRKLLEKLTRTPRAAPAEQQSPAGKDHVVKDARARLARVRDDMREACEGIRRGDLDIADLAQE